jgi:transposase
MTLEAPMYALLTQLLDIPNYHVVSAEIETDKITLDIESTSQTAACHHCGKSSKALHERHPRMVRDLPISGKPTYLRFIRRRFFCEDCHRAFSESLGFVDERRGYTHRYQAWIFHQVRENNIGAVHRAEGLTYDQIESIFLHEARCRIPLTPFANLKRSTERIARAIEIPLGIDEIALRKGRGDFALILTNLDTKEVVDVLKARTQEKLRARLEQLSPFERAQIQEVAIDMWNPYDTVCAELLPSAVITADRFHVMQAVNRELKQLKNQQKKVYPQALKGVHYALLKNRKDLTHKQQAALERVYQVSPLVKTAHRLKECLRHIFECKSTKEKAIERLRKWSLIAEKAGLFPQFRRTLANWMHRIANYFCHRTTSGMVEGINNKIKLIKRRAFGFRNFDHFRIRVIAAFL